MSEVSIYERIKERTGESIYIGVVGPVRSGKSTFIRRFMESLVIPNMSELYSRERAKDELPQASAGSTIMTTEPKFIPEDAAVIDLGGVTSIGIRLIDCVGYIIPSASGYIENGAARMVRTPWFDEEIPFNMAAEIGTQKVISEHSTVGIIVTTDGGITGIDREEYKECEERLVGEMHDLGKPFVMLMNTQEPNSQSTVQMCSQLEDEYGCAVIPISCLEMTESDILGILERLLYAFPIREIDIKMPRWINSLAATHPLKSELFSRLRQAAESASELSHIKRICSQICECEQIESAEIIKVDPGSGNAVIEITPQSGTFYEVLSDESGLNITGQDDLLPMLLKLVAIKREFEKFESALKQVEQTGYGIVMPEQGELSLDEPEIIRQGQSFGVKLRASAPSIHLVKAEISAEVAPIVGSERQSEELIDYLMSDYELDPSKIWETNIFGKSLNELVSEGLHSKLTRLPPDARDKLREAIERIINEGCSGLICLLI